MYKKEVKKQIQETTHRWIEQVVVGLNLCPFAHAPYVAQKVRIAITDAANKHDLLSVFVDEIRYLEQNPNKETTLLVMPEMRDAVSLTRILVESEWILLQKKMEKRYQVVSFHPQARIKEYPPDSPLNLVVMAPYPIIHILRDPSVERLGHKTRTDVQAANTARLSAMSTEDFVQIWHNMLKA